MVTVFWWIIFGCLVLAILTGLSSFVPLRHRYLSEYQDRLTWQERFLINHKLSKEILFSDPAWIRRDDLNRKLQLVYRVCFSVYFFGIVGFIITALFLS